MLNNQYNAVQYNEVRYNIQDLFISLADSVASAELNTLNTTRGFVDAIIMTDVLTKQITQKVLTETIRTFNWFSSRKNPAQGVWKD